MLDKVSIITLNAFEVVDSTVPTRSIPEIIGGFNPG